MTQAHDKKRYTDTYKGTVALNLDPEMRGRCYIIVPEISPIPLMSPADINFPFGGAAAGMFASAPMIGSCVWVQFRGGDIDKPLIVGARFENTAEVPALAHTAPPGVDIKVIATQLQNQIVISDVPGPTGGIMLLTPTGAGILINTLGVTIFSGGLGMITITAAGVDINGIGPAAGLSVR